MGTNNFTPIDELVKKPNAPKKHVAALVVLLLAITLPILGFYVYQSQERSSQADYSIEPTPFEPEAFCGQTPPYSVIPPGSQLGANECKKKTPSCYECRHGSGQIEFFGCCSQETPVPTEIITLPFPSVTEKPTPTLPKIPPTLTPTPPLCPLPSLDIEIFCPLCNSINNGK